MDRFPRTGCSAIVVRDQRVLLIKRGKEPYNGFWSLPGGAQELGETLVECVKRELTEETGIIAGSTTFLTTRDRVSRDTVGEITHHYVLTTFLIEEFEGTLCAGDDALDAGWFTLPEIDGLKTTPETPSFIREHVT